MKLWKIIACSLTLASFSACAEPAGARDTESRKDIQVVTQPQRTDDCKIVPVEKTDEQWKAELSPKEYEILREHGTERAFNGRYNDNKEDGVYVCAGCGLTLFDSQTKFNSGTGWPSFYQPIDKDFVADIEDNSYGMRRVENRCARCGGHLGHVFPDGPKPTGMRYCINGYALRFVDRDNLSDAENKGVTPVE